MIHSQNIIDFLITTLIPIICSADSEHYPFFIYVLICMPLLFLVLLVNCMVDTIQKSQDEVFDSTKLARELVAFKANSLRSAGYTFIQPRGAPFNNITLIYIRQHYFFWFNNTSPG